MSREFRKGGVIGFGGDGWMDKYIDSSLGMTVVQLRSVPG